jgi:hypothetical protein
VCEQTTNIESPARQSLSALPSDLLFRRPDHIYRHIFLPSPTCLSQVEGAARPESAVTGKLTQMKVRNVSVQLMVLWVKGALPGVGVQTVLCRGES